MQLPLDSAYTYSDTVWSSFFSATLGFRQIFILWSDTFQLVSVTLTKGAGQDLEGKEHSVVLDGVGASMKHIAFGREVCSPLYFFLLCSVGWLVLVFFLSNELYAVYAFIQSTAVL